MADQTSNILIYQAADGKAMLEVKLDQETVWLNLNQMVALFERDKSVISRHLKNIFLSGELDRNAVVAFFATTAADKKTYQVEPLAKVLKVGCQCQAVVKFSPDSSIRLAL